jgi:hypothetical protein
MWLDSVDGPASGRAVAGDGEFEVAFVTHLNLDFKIAPVRMPSASVDGPKRHPRLQTYPNKSGLQGSNGTLEHWALA